MSELDDDNNAFDNNDDDNNEDTDQWFNVNFVDDFSNKDKDCERSSFKNKDKDADSKRWSLRRGRAIARLSFSTLLSFLTIALNLKSTNSRITHTTKFCHNILEAQIVSVIVLHYIISNFHFERNKQTLTKGLIQFRSEPFEPITRGCTNSLSQFLSSTSWEKLTHTV